MKEFKRALPEPTPETEHFWDGCRQGELRIQRCMSCNHSYFPPRPVCPECWSRDIEIYVASGKATLHSYIINHRPRPDMGTEPHSIAMVRLAEGPQMMSNIVDCPQTPEALILDMPLEVTFLKQSDTISLPQFKPAKDQADG
ncbi:Zn-ribbon domain-containing OB-fold protein [Novosphingobium pentaromativorans]|uniref:DUF35 domain-containing protein n=1 Tax=Novosphingobium pentaromativorans US6-1 TaxID=1088721 RepID=G6EDB2_9SPHN|nr:zinc ribbon domain-containing protein [Novosphingobium pentaromativorans]AIT79802.1 DNA-binding protein [Novosphingobium pentaromativorans US6-1]EHJ60711.1 protein of unknown function DUF35 [Novosphingobium pentaromativorans US6-1]